MEEALVQYLLAQPAIGALVSTRIWWSKRPQSDPAMPAIVLHRIGGLPDYTMRGASGLVDSRVQLDCRGATQASALAVRRAVTAAVSGKSFTHAGITFQGCFINNEFDNFESGAEAAERFDLASLDLQLWHNE